MEIEGKAVYLSDVHEFILNYNLHKLEYWQNPKKNQTSDVELRQYAEPLYDILSKIPL